jgi:hypothetical protein
LPELLTEGVALAWIYRRLLVKRWSSLVARPIQDRQREAARRREARRRGGVVVDLHTGETRPRNEDLN